jgi:hypothetical protein
LREQAGTFLQGVAFLIENSKRADAACSLILSGAINVPPTGGIYFYHLTCLLRLFAHSVCATSRRVRNISQSLAGNRRLQSISKIADPAHALFGIK